MAYQEEEKASKHTSTIVQDGTELEEAKNDGVDEDVQPSGCGILGRFPVLSVLIFAAAGIGIGVGLSFWNPEDPATKDVALKWIGLVGDLFIRALKCVVLPLVFVNVAIRYARTIQVYSRNVCWHCAKHISPD